MIDPHQESSSAKSSAEASSSPPKWVVRPDPDLADLIPVFLQNRRQELLELNAAASLPDFDLIRRTAHTWKGICRPYGFVHLETLSRALEGAGERENQPDVLDVLTQMNEYLEHVHVEFET